MLRETENLEEQGDILQYLVDTQGLDFNTGKSALEILLLFFFTRKTNVNNPVAEITFHRNRTPPLCRVDKKIIVLCQIGSHSIPSSNNS